MERSYLKFLVSELIFVKEDTLINLIPKTYERYGEIFGELENYVDTLNLNIRKLRRNIKLLDKFSPEDAKNKAEEEFEKAEKLFKNCDKDGLLKFLTIERPRELDISSEKLQFKREDLEIEISMIFDRFPLNQLDMLDDKDAIDFNLKRLKNVYEEYQEIYGGLLEELNLKIAEKYLPRN